MDINNILKYGVYCLSNNNLENIVEVQFIWKDKGLVKVHMYKQEEGFVEKIVRYENLSPVYLTKEMLKVLGFKEVEGNLWGLINENYFFLKEKNIKIIKDQGDFKYVKQSTDPNDLFGCKFIPIPYLHKLQDLIGRMNVDNLLIELNNQL